LTELWPSQLMNRSKELGDDVSAYSTDRDATSKAYVYTESSTKYIPHNYCGHNHSDESIKVQHIPEDLSG
jgi:hypothetical protein